MLPKQSTKDHLLEGISSREEFYPLYFKLLQERILDANVEFVGESTIRIVNKDGNESTTYLDSLRLKYTN